MTLPSFSRAQSSGTHLTIHRITQSHHGPVLLFLGNASEHLARSGDTADYEAISILMECSRQVFEEYAAMTTQPERLIDRIIDRLVDFFEGERKAPKNAERPKAWMSENRLPEPSR